MSTKSETEGSVQFWIGDWVNYGRKAYERGRYEEALEELDIEYQTLADLGWVVRQVEFSLRNENLTFNHHRVVVPLAEAEQGDWLDKAEKANWSVSTLGRAINESKVKMPSLKRLVW